MMMIIHQGMIPATPNARTLQAVGDGIEDLPDLAHLIEGARDDAVEAVGDGRNGEDDQCGHHPVIGDQPCDEGDGRDSQDADEVRHGEVDVPRLGAVLLVELLLDLLAVSAAGVLLCTHCRTPFVTCGRPAARSR